MSEGPEDYYVQDVEFGSAYNPQQTPVLLAYVAARAGFEPADPSGRFTYCDLGCGNGITLNGLAAANPAARFIGVDFNPQHIAQARKLAHAAELDNVEFLEASFTELEKLETPRFDFIAMNGIYSWLHPHIVETVIHFLSERLKPRGLFVVEYLTLPGAASVAPMWQLIRTLTRNVESQPVQRAAKGLELLVKLRQHSARYFVANPNQAGEVERMEKQGARDDRFFQWMAHNALAETWQPKYFTEVADELGGSGLVFAGSTQLRLNDLELAIPSPMIEMFDDVRDGAEAELLKDFILNQHQRTDVFIKAAAPRAAAARRYLQNDVYLCPRTPTQDVARSLSQLGRHVYVQNRELYTRQVEKLAEAEAPLSLGAVIADPETQETGEDERWRALSRLIVTGRYLLCASPQTCPTEAAPSGRWTLPLEYNRIAVERAVQKTAPATLVSAATGGGCALLIGIEPLLLWAHVQEEAEKRADYVRAKLSEADRLIPFAGEMMSPDWITAAQIDEALHRFRERRWPLLQRLGVVKSREQ